MFMYKFPVCREGGGGSGYSISTKKKEQSGWSRLGIDILIM